VKIAEPGDHDPVRSRISVSGLVQGVGFRPFVWREATVRGLSGWVGNDAGGVILEVEGPPEAVASLLGALARPPALARVDEVRSQALRPDGGRGFEIRGSSVEGARRALVPPDTATCADCAREVRDPADRRYRHPFVNCTSCGPRFTIVQSVPYDRARTTMADFQMCAACRAEYDDPADRRFHAEPVCCPRCGPSLRLTGTLAPAPDRPIAGAVAVLRSAGIVAVKGLGGYHLAAAADQEAAVSALRQRKHREDRPFAVMAADLTAARQLCEVSPAESDLLLSPARPIVILRRRPGAGVACSVAPGALTLGVMLPYTPLHGLLLDAYGGPLVLTSGNISDEPIAFEDADAVRRLSGIADAFLTHDREIRTRVDDSVVKIAAGRVLPMRRSRGYVPAPLLLAQEAPVPILSCGSALKNTFCVTRGRQAFVSQHIGDLADYATMRSYLDGISHLQRLLDVTPAVVAHDLHPDYPSTQHAMELPDVELVGVQHHHAHIASCLADNGHAGPVIGVAFDGVGLGADGSAWGGEFLLTDLLTYSRAAHLAEVAMPGGDAAARQPWRMAAAHLDAAYDGAIPAGLAVVRRQGPRWEKVLAACRAGINSPLTSSAGRLFDAVAALIGLRDVVTYEGQAAIELEQIADPAERGSYEMAISDEPVARIQVGQLIRAVAADVLSGTQPPVVAARFHHALAGAILATCSQLRDKSGLSTVALSGGVFQNALLLARCLSLLEDRGFTVLTHRQVPPNDGGISLGQAAIATAILSARGNLEAPGQDASAATVASQST